MATSAAKLRWVSITPLGLPVVPLVKSSEATSSGEAFLRTAPMPLGRSGSPAKASPKLMSLVPRPAAASAFSSAGCFSRMNSVTRQIFASLRRAMLMISASASSLSTGTAVQPARRMPKKATPHSGRFSPMSITRSCGCTPLASRALPTRAA